MAPSPASLPVATGLTGPTPSSRRGQSARALGLVLTVLLALVGLGQNASQAQASTIEFADVPPGTAFATEIQWLAAQGISTGWVEPNGSRTFRPTLSIQRNAMAAFMYRLAGSPHVSLPGASPFADVTPGQPFYKEMVWMYQSGISTGWVTNGVRTFRPAANVQRNAMAAFMYRAVGSPAYHTPLRSPFTDVRPGTPFYKEMAWLSDHAISAGYADGSFRPSLDVSRGAMAAFMYRLDRAVFQRTSSFPDGQWRVGQDILPGTYRAPGNLSWGCYWERVSDFSGELESIIANEYTTSTTIVTLAAGDHGFVSEDCGTWRPISATYPASPATRMGDGHYEIGRHIAPGTYRTTTADGCYWERQRGFSGQFEDLISNDYVTTSSVIVTLQAADVGFLSEGCGSWTRQ